MANCVRIFNRTIPPPGTYDGQLRPNFQPNVEQVIQKIKFIDENKKN